MVEKLFFHLFALPTVFKLHEIIQKTLNCCLCILMQSTHKLCKSTRKKLQFALERVGKISY